MRAASLAASLTLALGLAGCDSDPSDKAGDHKPAAGASQPAAADPLLARHPGNGQPAPVDIPDPASRPVMQLQVVLDRLGFTPGVVDGASGASTRNAIAGFQEANHLTPTGELDDATRKALARWNAIPATRVVTIPDAFAAGPFYAIPTKPDEQAKMPALGYASLDEKLAERFHTTVATLLALNPGGTPAGSNGAAASQAPPPPPPSSPSAAAPTPTDAAFTPQPGPRATFRAGQRIRVPNVGADRIVAGTVTDPDWLATLVSLGVGSEQPKVERIVVSKSKGTLKAYDKAGALVGMYTATMGSRHDPLPLGRWKVNGVSHNPAFHYNAALFWDASDKHDKQRLPAGPNGPVGVVWIDLNKLHYGIHGTPEPQTIGRSESHGCVRLTNWDAARLAQMVAPGTQVLFEE